MNFDKVQAREKHLDGSIQFSSVMSNSSEILIFDGSSKQVYLETKF